MSDFQQTPSWLDWTDWSPTDISAPYTPRVMETCQESGEWSPAGVTPAEVIEETEACAIAACDAGTATLRQYEIIAGDSVATWQLEVLASVPALVAREAAGGAITPESAVAYPPGLALDTPITREIRQLYRDATYPLTMPWAPPEAQAVWAWLRAVAAGRLLVLMDAQALSLRRRAWRDTPTGAVLSDEVTELAAIRTLTLSKAELFLGLGSWLTNAVSAGQITAIGTERERRLGSAKITYAQLATAVHTTGIRGATPRPVPGLARSRD